MFYKVHVQGKTKLQSCQLFLGWAGDDGKMLDFSSPNLLPLAFRYLKVTVTVLAIRIGLKAEPEIKVIFCGCWHNHNGDLYKYILLYVNSLCHLNMHMFHEINKTKKCFEIKWNKKSIHWFLLNFLNSKFRS